MKSYSDTQTHIREAAKKEFHEKGFKEASLRSIAKNANVTTGALYGYYKSKEALFEDLVKEAADGLMVWYFKIHQAYMEKTAQEQKENMAEISDTYVPVMIAYIYQHLDAFRLILCCSAGTKYEQYLDRLIKIEEESCWEFLDALEKTGYKRPVELDDILIHIMSSAYFQAIYEMVAHNVPEDKAQAYMKALSKFQYAGWFGMLEL